MTTIQLPKENNKEKSNDESEQDELKEDSEKDIEQDNKFTCNKCGKKCKDKRGLTVHSHKCGIDKRFICGFCNQEFATAYSLSVHVPRCKTLKSKNELMAKEELATLRADLEASKKEIAKLLVLNEETKEELFNLKIFISNDYTQLKNDFNLIKVKNDMLEKENTTLIVDKQILQELNIRLSYKQ